ncbi:MAG: hypothetical protein ACOYOV_15120 [Bacteroidales bacterium]
MKKINLIIAGLLLLSGILFYSCKKEENTNNSQSSQNKLSINNNKESRGIERLFDEDYVKQLIEISGIDPKKLSQDEAIWDPYHNGLRAINACFVDKYLYFLENEPWNAGYCSLKLNQAKDYFAAGDTLNGLTYANLAYAKAGCGSLTPFFYQGHSFDLPALEIAKEIETYKAAEEILINKYPNLNKIDEQYKMDILTLAVFYSENVDTKASCRTKYNMAISAAIAEGVMCSAGCGQLIIPHLIIAAEIVCATLCTYACYTAYDNYRTCLQGH